MYGYFTLTNQLNEIPRDLGDPIFNRFFKFDLPYAKKVYYVEQHLLVNRQSFGDERFCIELYQAIVPKIYSICFALHEKHPLIISVLRGSASLVNKKRGSSMQLKAGECLLSLPEASEYAFELDSILTKIVIVVMNGSWFKENFSELVNFAGILNNHTEALPICRIRFSLWQRLLSLLDPKQHLPYSSNFMSRIIIEIVLLYHRYLLDMAKNSTQRLNSVSNYILSCIKRNDQIPAVSAIARKCNFTQRELENTCREVTGMPPIQYINKLRLQEVYRRLQETNLQVNEIAHLMWYRSPSYLSSRFRKVYGLTPKEVREMEETRTGT